MYQCAECWRIIHNNTCASVHFSNSLNWLVVHLYLPRSDCMTPKIENLEKAKTGLHDSIAKNSAVEIFAVV